MDKCKDCRWYVGHQFQGNCHRHAPIKDTTSTSPFQNAAWPDLSGDCGCGDHEEMKTRTNHNHDYYHDDCSLCIMEKEND